MKTTKLLIIILFAVAGCKKEKTVIQEVPTGIIHTNPCPSLYTKVLDFFPQSQNNRIKNAAFFSDTIQKEIIVATESEVFIALVDENAYFNNTVGWYSYDKSSVPLKSSEVKLQVLFPNVSLIASGGALSSGDMLKVGTGKFKAGTVIGFFFIANGWQHKTINWSQPIMYTDSTWNPGMHQQHVLYKDTTCKAIVLTWEDTPLDQISPKSDLDFNDVVFEVSDNNQGLEATSFDLTKMIKH